ncbi:pyruvate kinase [Candidatus Aerophobetes bacterium]|nr:pyruvate kinase [Candidatus Aerophobetes bacterium]
MRKTKIICTLGPATRKRKVLEDIIRAGMNIARLNFSHGSFQEHRTYFENVQEISRKLKKTIGVIQDLEGYKIRTGSLREKKVQLRKNDYVWFIPEEIGKGKEIGLSYPELARYVREGDRMFIDDGKIEIRIEKIQEGKIKGKVLVGGILEEHKGIHVPGANLEFPSLTEKDRKDIQFGVELGVDYIAQSFVREAKDILLVKDVLKEMGKEIPVIAKIEDERGVRNIDQIIEVADAIMIARGDMGVCLPREKVPLIQKMIIRKCNKVGKPVITATQMLDSMIQNPHPTRAEVTDVANAIIDGTDLVMLSGETATGLYPVEAVREMHRIAVTIEKSLDYHRILEERDISPEESIQDSIAFAARQLAEFSRAEAIMAFTLSGTTATIISKYRPRCRIIGITPSIKVAKKLLLYWGVEVMVIEKVQDIERHFEDFVQEAVEKRVIKKGKLVVVTGGIKREEEKPTGTIKILST